MWFLKEKSDHYRKQSFLSVFLAVVCFEFHFFMFTIETAFICAKLLGQCTDLFIPVIV